RNIVITRDASWQHQGVLTCHTLEEALERAFEQALIDDADAAMVVGGAEIYRLALPRADKVVLTRVRGQVAGDVVFDLDLLAGWKEVETAHHAAEGGNSHAFTVVELTPPLNG
ncbi:MAG: dihydrofolate reductase, partial [Pseudomonadota bacterium]|nr:dihydrofolate reductase [Pseudomonadota bacterium]